MLRNRQKPICLFRWTGQGLPQTRSSTTKNRRANKPTKQITSIFCCPCHASKPSKPVKKPIFFIQWGQDRVFQIHTNSFNKAHDTTAYQPCNYHFEICVIRERKVECGDVWRQRSEQPKRTAHPTPEGRRQEQRNTNTSLMFTRSRSFTKRFTGRLFQTRRGNNKMHRRAN